MIAELDDIGLAWDEDGAGAVVGSTMGNILCRLPGRSEEGTPIFLCAHLDTVPADGPLEPVVDEEGSSGTPAGRFSAPTTSRQSS